MVGPEGAGGGGTRQAGAAGSRLERAPEDQPQGKWLLVISYPFPGFQDPARLRQKESCFVSTEDRTPKFREVRH